MKKLEKLILPALIMIVLVVIYSTYFAPTEKLGDFTMFGGSEINQRINVIILKERGVRKTDNGDIISFRAKDINNKIVTVSLREPEPASILNASIVELLGHMHGNDFTAAKVKVIK
ncbi:MAG: hypothetical protein L3J41_15000 [Melioribacteraceae bacterium]|nr:hypothetical protein [Melioribacteraceae bacterium]